MREINAAWHVLQDPARRRAYDADRLATEADARRGATRRPTPSGPPRSSVPAVTDDDEDLVDVLPPMTALTAGLFRHLPWVLMLLVFGAIFVLSAYAQGPGEDVPASTVGAPAEIGSCLDVRAGPTTSIVPCSGPHDLQVVDRVASIDGCPSGSEARRLSEDGRFECVVPG